MGTQGVRVAASRPILVVDDDAKIVRLVRTYLEREGLRVIEAADGRSALAAIELERPALVVLDLMLPEIDGLAVVRAVRRAADQTPIIILSARGTTADRIGGLALGADDYLAKPFSPAELVLRVKRVLARAGGAAGAARDGTDPAVALNAGRGPVDAPLVQGNLVVDRARHSVEV
ncbi:MAG: response regulator transcription factor, partial [Candidatus Limnocylindrales bacterium]